jgi:N-acetylmuramoyl-L-alanine amidase
VSIAQLGPVHWLTIHCAATPEGRDVNAATISDWDRAKFGQVSYHHVITLDGVDHRTLRDDQKGAHVGGHNTGNIGICYVGGMDAHNEHPKDTRTEAQKVALLTLIRTYKGRYPGIKILGHRDWPGVAKACPSFSVADWLNEVGE